MARQGVATLVVCSTVFEALGHAQARSLGMPELPVVVMPHPFGLRSRAEVQAIAADCVQQVATLMLEKQA